MNIERRILLLGGSFDPVHNAHVALASYFSKLLFPDELRILPSGNPWHKQALEAAPEDRMAMLKLAFANQGVPVVIDDREIKRDGPTYTIDTLREIRAEVGPRTALILAIGADQLQKLASWKAWKELFDYAHLCAASRPGFALDLHTLPAEVRREFERRAATPEQVRESRAGLTCTAGNLAIDVSSTQIRQALREGGNLERLIPPAVLDYIEAHHLYKNSTDR